MKPLRTPTPGRPTSTHTLRVIQGLGNLPFVTPTHFAERAGLGVDRAQRLLACSSQRVDDPFSPVTVIVDPRHDASRRHVYLVSHVCTSTVFPRFDDAAVVHTRASVFDRRWSRELDAIPITTREWYAVSLAGKFLVYVASSGFLSVQLTTSRNDPVGKSLGLYSLTRHSDACVVLRRAAGLPAVPLYLFVVAHYAQLKNVRRDITRVFRMLRESGQEGAILAAWALNPELELHLRAELAFLSPEVARGLWTTNGRLVALESPTETGIAPSTAEALSLGADVWRIGGWHSTVRVPLPPLVATIEPVLVDPDPPSRRTRRAPAW